MAKETRIVQGNSLDVTVVKGGDGQSLREACSNLVAQADKPLWISPTNRIAQFEKFGKIIRFVMNTPEDLIQRHHIIGRFYEETELSQIQKFLPLNGVFLDIGTNTGNHSVFVAKFLNPKKIISIEPNPHAVELLLSNVKLNDVRDVFDFQHLGIGLGKQSDSGFAIVMPDTNLGAARLEAGTGDLEIAKGDDLFADVEQIDLIKIDVEGMEIDVLHGLSDTFDRLRPNLLIEVDTQNRQDFVKWMDDKKYQLAVRFKRTKDNQNFIVTPKALDTGRPKNV